MPASTGAQPLPGRGDFLGKCYYCSLLCSCQFLFSAVQVEKSRVAEVAKRAEEAHERRMAAKEAARKAEQRDGSSDDERARNDGYTAADLAGLKVGHGSLCFCFSATSPHYECDCFYLLFFLSAGS